MQISFPFNLAFGTFRWTFGWLTKAFFLETYRRSHEIWIEHHRLGAYWYSCGQYLEYTVYLALSADPKPRNSMIAFRATGKDIDSLSLVFEADSGATRFQEKITLSNVTPKPIIWTMPNIPYQSLLKFSNGTGPRFSWNSYKLHDIRLKFKNGTEITPFETERHSLTHTWLLNSTWSYRWKRCWNLDAIQWSQRRIREYWLFGFGCPAIKTFGPNGYERNLIQQIVEWGTRPFAWLMSRPWSVSVQFWVATGSRLFVLDDEGELQWRWNSIMTRDKT